MKPVKILIIDCGEVDAAIVSTIVEDVLFGLELTYDYVEVNAEGTCVSVMNIQEENGCNLPCNLEKNS